MGGKHGTPRRAHPAAVSGDRLKLLRAAAGLTQAELAAQAGVSVRTVGQLERGGAGRPQAASIHRLATALGVAEEELFPPREVAAGTSALVTPPGAGPGEPDAGDHEQDRVPLWVGVLGPLEVRRAGRTVEITSPILRAMLGLLAMRPGRVISVSEFVDTLWEEDPPRTSRDLVNTYLSHLRRLLEPGLGARAPGRRLRREPTGYRLLLEPAESDSGQFRDLVRRAEQARADGAHQSAWQLYIEALDCWRGPPGADGERLARHAESSALARDRLSAVLAWADLGLGFAYYGRVAPVLQALAAEEPLHEGIAARLMIALAGDGRQAAALSLFSIVRERLDSDLGMSPGQELREAHLGVLRGRLPIAVPPWSLNGAGATTPAPPVEGTGPRRPSPPIPARPAQLPADVSAFTGREAELRALDALLPPVLAAGAEAGEGSGGPGATPLDGAAAVSPGSGTRRSAPPVAVITGMAGMGKTALALHWAHRARRRFPGGQLFADLRGNGDDPARPIDVLAGFLGALGVPPESVPADEDEASALLRSCLDGKLVLIVLDNAATAQQARPLLAASPGSATLITARDRLTSLAARNGAALLTLEALPQPASAALLAQVIGQHRANAEPAEVAALSELCAHLPLALRIAAANLTTRPTWRLAEYVTKLAASDRLTTLSVEGDPQTAVRAAFESSCDALEPTDRRLFSLAGIAPGRDLAVDSAAVLAGIAQAQAERSLERLAARNLVVEHASGRYKFHDLLRLYAGDLAEAEQPVAERDAALERLAAHVRRRLEHVADLVFPHLLRLPRLDGEPKQGPDTALEPTRGASGAGAGVAFPDAAAAIAWLEAERANLVDLVGRLVDDGSYHLALHIADHLCSHFILRLEVVDFEVVITAAQRAATAVENPAALAAVALWRGHMHGGRSRFADSARDFAESAALASRSGWADCEAVALNNLAHSRWMSGQIEDAIAGWREALELNRRSGRTVGEAVTLANLGAAHLQLARLGPGNRDDDPAGEAMRLLEEALTLHRKVRDRRNEAATVRLIAEAHRDRGDQRRALDLVREALRLAAETGDPRGEVQARSTLATVLVRSGDTESGLDEHRRTLHLARDLGNLQTEAAILLELAGTHLQLGQPEDAMLAVRDVESLVALTSVPMLERQIRWVRRRIADTAVA